MVRVAVALAGLLAWAVIAVPQAQAVVGSDCSSNGDGNRGGSCPPGTFCHESGWCACQSTETCVLSVWDAFENQCVDCSSLGVEDCNEVSGICEWYEGAPGRSEGWCAGTLNPECDDCNSNGIPDPHDVDCGTDGGPCNADGKLGAVDGQLWRFDFYAVQDCLFFDLYSHEVRYLRFNTSDQLVENWMWVPAQGDFLNVQYPSTNGPSYTAYRDAGQLTTGTDRLISSLTFDPDGGTFYAEETVDATGENEPGWGEWGTTYMSGSFDSSGLRIEGEWDFESVQQGSVCGTFTARRIFEDCNDNGKPDECELGRSPAKWAPSSKGTARRSTASPRSWYA